MSDFKPIETQEQLDIIIGERIKRAETKAAEKYQDYDDLKQQVSDLTGQLSELNDKLAAKDKDAQSSTATIDELKAKIKSYETRAVKTRIAHEVGLPFQLAEKLSGETEEEIKKDAETMAKFLTKQAPAPLGDPEPVSTKDQQSAALMDLAHNLVRK